MYPRIFIYLFIVYGLLTCSNSLAATESDDPFQFDDVPLTELITYPEWFKKSFLDLQEDLDEAITGNKQGIIVYFGQKRCAYCKRLMDVNFKLPDIVQYTRSHFDVIPIDIWSPEELTTPTGKNTTEREYALEMRTNFTPSLIFYTRGGEIALRLRGYYAPYQFRAALEFVAGAHYLRESFPVYMARGDSTLRFEAEDLVEEDFFSPPPFNLDRSRFPGDRPIAVFFEQGNCHACDVLHTQPLRQDAIQDLFGRFDSVQLDMWSESPIITPDGDSTTAREWARKLGVFYAPSVIFFDEDGKEIIKVESVVHFFRLRNVLNYVLSKGYLSHPNFQQWRSAQN
jgi:thioredoxin-related protein